ncbi:hypothetical protein ACHAWO_002492 [Cyclotella atomus]|uniref:Uncharacterized protein n=1 Tax=Cyclotella atomus TaxID=382360 RepID=A0ABD3N8R5_9STRA
MLLVPVKYFVLDLGSYASASRKREGYTLKLNLQFVRILGDEDE